MLGKYMPLGLLAPLFIAIIYGVIDYLITTPKKRQEP